MTDAAIAVGVLSAGVAAVGVAALAVPPTRRLAPRVRPYTIAARTRFGRGAEAADLVAAPSASSPVARLFGPPVLSLVRRIGRTLERRSDTALDLSLRQAGFVGVTADEYRSRVAVQVLVFGAAGAGVGVLAFHRALAALGLGLCGVVFGASKLRGRLERAIADRRERIRLELYTVNQLLAMHVRTGAGPVQATQRIVDRGQGPWSTSCARCWQRCTTGSRNRLRSVAPPSSLPSRPPPARTSSSLPAPSAGSTSPTACAR